jgi:hypothetical protein
MRTKWPIGELQTKIISEQKEKAKTSSVAMKVNKFQDLF